MKQKVSEFLKKDSAGGILLITATIFALILVNSPLENIYHMFLHLHLSISIGDFILDKSFLHWINDGLMAIFFLVVGLEVKREIIDGNLSSIREISLPAIAAIGGMLVPALFYLYFNSGDEVAMRGWAIPTATDIAFALGILSLLGNRVPLSLKIFLMALAIIDDLGAIVIIALFYTSEISMLSTYVALISLTILIIFNILGYSRKSLYFVVGLILWISVLKSGVHATLAGVALAFTIPFKAKDEKGQIFSPIKEIEHGLHPWITFFILPLFAFVNAGVDLRVIELNQMTNSVPLGIIAGLFLGKQIGVFGFSFIAIKLKIASLPKDSSWLMLYGVSILTGIGFTMSLFITSLAFTDDALFAYTDKLAIIVATLLSSVIGYLVLKVAISKK
ncbi:Na+/H+ antiporter NhaA type [hydrothermal vent metagenome]|uniref:Na+/H+ antiporter NhaA type n=1 Tax=hydrothermal vent metagenome TaxID=652676 RepID=A0A1W1BKB7_9ZZZZ